MTKPIPMTKVERAMLTMHFGHWAMKMASPANRAIENSARIALQERRP